MDAPYRPTVHTQAELEGVWARLMGPWGFGRRSIWMVRLDEERALLPVITEIAECDGLPDPELASGLADVLAGLDEDGIGGSFAFLISRPGGSRVLDDDLIWGRMILEAGHRAGVKLEPLHLATDEATLPLPPDELVTRRSA